MTTLYDILPALNDTWVFNLLDVKDGFMHVTLSDLAEATIWCLLSARTIPMATCGIKDVPVVADDVLSELLYIGHQISGEWS